MNEENQTTPQPSAAAGDNKPITSWERETLEKVLLASVHDLEMARNANIDAVGVGSGANDRDELLDFNPLLVLGNMVDLREFLL